MVGVICTVHMDPEIWAGGRGGAVGSDRRAGDVEDQIHIRMVYDVTSGQ